MPFIATTTNLTSQALRLTIKEGDQILSFAQVIQHWVNSSAFRDFYTSTLLQHGGNGCFWEHPRLNKETVDQAYECVISRTDTFSRLAANFNPFKNAVQAGKTISVFPNLTGVAQLIVPAPTGAGDFNGRDLIAFLKTADEARCHKLWIVVGQQVTAAIAEGSSFQFLSTHGLGVLWLHIRLEQRPKYYHHRPYRSS